MTTEKPAPEKAVANTADTPQRPLIYEALSSVMGEVTAVGKDSINKAQGFNFRGIDAILNMVAPALRKHCVTVVPQVEAKEYEVVTTKSGGTMGHAVLTVRYRFTAIDGSFVETLVYGEAMDSGDKTYSKAMSVAFRTALIQCLTIPTNDKDPDESSYERGDANSGRQTQKITDATDEDVRRISGMVENSKTEADLVQAGYEMKKFNVTQPDTDMIVDQYRAKKAEIDRFISGAAWESVEVAKPAPAQAAPVKVNEPSVPVIEEFATSQEQIDALRTAQSALMNAPDMPSIIRIIKAYLTSANIGFPSVEDDEMTTLRIASQRLPLMASAKVEPKQEVANA